MPGMMGYNIPNFSTTPGSSSSSGFDFTSNQTNTNLPWLNRKGPDIFAGINQLLAPQLKYQLGLQSPITQQFMQYLSGGPGGAFGAAETAAAGAGADLFRVGGPLQNSILQALGGTAGKGFQPGGAEGAVNSITRQGVHDVASIFAQQAGPLAQQWANLLSGGFGQTTQNVQDLINSILTGGANVSQLQLAQKATPKPGLLGLGFGPL